MLQLCPSCIWEDGCPFCHAHVQNCWNYESKEDVRILECEHKNKKDHDKTN